MRKKSDVGWMIKVNASEALECLDGDETFGLCI